ncbi:MAG: hypothetical protein PHG48_03030 [Eubacteriales bacterium]|nr:hypothetical protein [Eubacteriales bacterium]
MPVFNQYYIIERGVTKMSSVPQPANTAAGNPPEKPLTLIGLAGFMIKGFFKSIPKQILWTILRAVLSFVVVFIVHTWLVVYKNDGFWPDASKSYYRLIAFTDTKTQSVAFWSIAAFLLSSFAGRIFYGGFRKLFADFVSTPDWVITNLRKSGRYSLPAFLTGIILSIAASFFLKSNYVMAVSAIALFLSITSGAQGMWFLVLSTGWSDIKRLFLRNKDINHGPVAVITFGLALGMIIAASFSQVLWVKIVIIVLCVAGFVLLVMKKKVSPSTLIWLGALMAFQAFMLRVSGVYADDGGWSEAGSSFWSWWNSAGRDQAVGMSVPPGLSALLGALFGGGGLPKPPPIPEVMDYNVQNWKWHNEDGKWVLYQTDKAGNKHGKGLPQSLFSADPELLGNQIRIFNQPTCDYNSSAEKMESMMSNLGEGYTNHFTSDGWKALTLDQKEKTLSALSEMIADVAGVDPKTIKVKLVYENNKGSNGAWDPNTRTIELNRNSNNFDNPLKTIKTLAHEMRHAAQEDPKADLGGGKDYRDLMTWNNDNYVTSGTDFTRYSGQLLERDADGFGRRIGTTILQQAMKNKYKIE